MKIKFPKTEVLKGLGLIQGIVEKRTTMPILTNVLLEAAEGKLSITATDLEVGVNLTYSANVETPGKVAVHARNFYDIVRELADDTVYLSVGSGNWVEITCAKSRYKIVGLSSDEFPSLPGRDRGEVWNVGGKLINEMIDKTSFAVSTDETRFNLNGVYADPVKGKSGNFLRMVATDGHRLSIIERNIEASLPFAKGVIIPRKGVSEIKKILDEGSALDIWINSKYLIVYKGNITLVVRLIEGQFPPYEQIIPKLSKRVVQVNKNSLTSALRRVSVLSTERSSGVKFNVSSKNMEISMMNPDLGEAREEIEIDYRGEAFEIGFNAKYFLDALSHIDDEQAVLQLGDEMSPCILKSELDRGFTHVIMPMRL